MTRQHKRYYVLFPMQYDAVEEKEAYAVSRNMSQSGLLMATAARLEINAPVKVAFKLPGTDEERTMEGKIVRVDDNSADREGLFPFMAAVEFTTSDDKLEPFLKDAEAKSEFPPAVGVDQA